MSSLGLSLHVALGNLWRGWCTLKGSQSSLFGAGRFAPRTAMTGLTGHVLSCFTTKEPRYDCEFDGTVTLAPSGNATSKYSWQARVGQLLLTSAKVLVRSFHGLRRCSKSASFAIMHSCTTISQNERTSTEEYRLEIQLNYQT